MSNGASVRVDVDGHVAELVLDRPDQLNAVDQPMLEAVVAGLDRVEADPEVRVLVLRGAGRAFCSGGDLGMLEELTTRPAALAEHAARWHAMVDRLLRSPVPSIAAVHGVAMAGGFELLLACDLVVVADDARLGDGHARYGLFPGGGGSQLLPRMVGPRRAKWLMFSGELVSPEVALTWGLVNEVVEPERVRARALELAGLLAARSPTATAAMKEAVREGLQLSALEGALALELDLLDRHMRSEDAHIGLRAFAAREEPRFVGR